MAESKRTLFRQWLMLQKLPRAPQRITAHQLAQRLANEGYPVSKRSVERDLQALSEIFPLDCDDRAKPFGWAWAKTAPSFSLPGMSPLQALVLLTAQTHLKGLLPAGHLAELQPLFRQAGQTLRGATGKEGLAAWSRSVVVVPTTQPLVPPEVDSEVLETVHEAVLSRRPLQLTYRPRYETADKAYTAHPVGLVLRGVVTYLACLIEDFTDARLLALHRIQSATLAPGKARPATPAVLREAGLMAAAGFNDRGPIELVIEMFEDAAFSLQESPVSRDQTVRPAESEGWIELRATVNDTDQLRWWLLGFGENIEVISPLDLRADIAQKLADAAEYYE